MEANIYAEWAQFWFSYFISFRSSCTSHFGSKNSTLGFFLLREGKKLVWLGRCLGLRIISNDLSGICLQNVKNGKKLNYNKRHWWEDDHREQELFHLIYHFLANKQLLVPMWHDNVINPFVHFGQKEKKPTFFYFSQKNRANTITSPFPAPAMLVVPLRKDDVLHLPTCLFATVCRQVHTIYCSLLTTTAPLLPLLLCEK